MFKRSQITYIIVLIIIISSFFMTGVLGAPRGVSPYPRVIAVPQTVIGTSGTPVAGQPIVAGNRDSLQLLQLNLILATPPPGSITPTISGPTPTGATPGACGTDNDNDGYCPPQDCDDNDYNVHPGQTQFFTTPRRNGTFDYDCDGNILNSFEGSGTLASAYTVAVDTQIGSGGVSWRNGSGVCSAIPGGGGTHYASVISHTLGPGSCGKFVGIASSPPTTVYAGPNCSGAQLGYNLGIYALGGCR